MAMQMKPGYGYWDITSYPIGGKFCRSDKNGGNRVKIVSMSLMDRPYKGCNATGATMDNRRIAFHTDNTLTSN